MSRLINMDGRDVTSETLAAIRKVMGNGQGLEKAETITTSTGLVAYDLEAPAKNLYPVVTPLRNRIPRNTRGSGAGDAANWKEVSGITGSGVASMPWVAEGQRAARMSITATPKSATYVTLGEEADVTFEAQSAGQGFEDVLSSSGMRLLHSLMIKEEYAILGGNRSVDLGKPVTPTVTVDSDGGTIDAGSYNTVNVRVIPLTLEGYLAASLSAGIQRSVTVTGMDGNTFTLYAGSGKASDVGSQSITGSTNAVAAYTTAIKGAAGYAWYVELRTGAGETQGNSHLEAITTINSVLLTSLAGTHQTLTAAAALGALATDFSKNATLAFDGLLYSAFNSALSYYSALATGTPGVGTGLTSSGRGSISQIDTMLESFWSNYRLSPEEIYVNAQELRNITNKAMHDSGGSSLLQLVQPKPMEAPVITAGAVVAYYFNPFTLNGGQMIPVKLHPNLTPGTLFAWCQNLPGYYESANVPETAGVQCRRDYYQIPWPLATRRNETGVYAEEVLKVYAPFALGVITNIADA